MIDRGELVGVIGVHGNRVVVRLVEDDQADDMSSIDIASPVG